MFFVKVKKFKKNLVKRKLYLIEDGTSVSMKCCQMHSAEAEAVTSVNCLITPEIRSNQAGGFY